MNSSILFYHKTDLLFNYDWTTEEYNPKLRGHPDYSLFNRNQGWEVLYIINQFGKKNRAEVLVIGHKAEKMIRNHLPETACTQINVMDWMKLNWSKY
jgi:hypothetical protein